MSLQNDLTTGNIRTQILKFAFPLIISNFFQALYNAVDMFFVGRYTGTIGLSAVSVCGPIMNIMIMTISGLSIGVAIVIAKYVGNKHIEDVKKSANSAIALYLVLSLIVSFFGYLFTPYILKLVNTPVQAFSAATDYLHVIFIGIIFMFGYNLISAFQRGFGDSKSSMYFVITAGLFNIILDYIFVALLNKGAFGAALATVMSQAISLIMGIVYFRMKKHVITFHPKEIRIYKNHLIRLLTAGLPAAGQQLLLNVSLLTLSGIANSFGLVYSAVYGIGIKIDSFAVLPSDAINMSLVSFVSQNIGGGKPDRATKALKEAIKLGICISVVIAAIILLFSYQIVSIFNSDHEVIGATIDYLKIAAISYIIYAVIHPFIGFIRGSGNAIQTLINVVFSQYLIRIPVAIICTNFFGFSGVPMAVIAGPTFSLLMYGYFIISGRWKKSHDYQEMIIYNDNNKAGNSNEIDLK
ncbi:putative MATE family efflux protein [Mobilisporobacter senegalensis]|uniref:Probable multidrug resistance protein NorM n=1 Tax=Mobilisporobacter senegalensis TaxID=1329262 RepID=A0A3N1XRS9_9FIRM|nr:MATE family efflux transporter [Mobilisporobacter senegalensis]ROR29373.1 putative MATE family efflux protein [Mobilisporobacter senegalensis]